MNSQPRFARLWIAGRLLMLALAPWLLISASLGAPPEKQLYYNQDCTEFFAATEVPAGKAGELIDRYVDQIADAGVTVFLCNTNSRRVNYRSRVWETYWEGYDPAGPDDQPFLAPVPPDEKAIYRKVIDHMWRVDHQGVDYPGRVIARCRQRNVSPWISLRMNDRHYEEISNHPFHGSFWVKHPEFRRQNATSYFSTCLDYARPEVRDHFMALIKESLERYDVDGLELDFMREPYYFSVGKEREGAPILTAWMREVRQVVNEAAARRGHPIKLGARAPSRPETALGLGLDAVSWAKEGLIDVLVVTPRQPTIEFDLAIPEWRRQLGEAKVTLLGGLEIHYRPAPLDRGGLVSAELAQGAASAILGDGADAIYLFNYFPEFMAKPAYQDMLRAMTSLESLQAVPRTIGVTFRDLIAPGESYQPPLPARGAEVTFPMKLGPAPPPDWRRDVVISLGPVAGVPASKPPRVTVDGDPCDLVEFKDAGAGVRQATVRMPIRPWVQSQPHEVKIASGDEAPLLVLVVEVSMRP